MKNIWITVALLLTCHVVFGSYNCLYTSTERTITIKWVNLCDFYSQKYLDSITKHLATRLHRPEDATPMLVLVELREVSHPDAGNGFVSVSYDKLKSVDEKFIHNAHQERITTKGYSEEMLFDYYATNEHEKTQKGLKIIYDADTNGTNWNDIETLMRFAIANEKNIRKNQQRMKMAFICSGCKVKLLTYNINEVRTLLGWPSLPEKPKHIPVPKGSRTCTYRDISFKVLNAFEKAKDSFPGSDAYRLHTIDKKENATIGIVRADPETIPADMKEMSVTDYCYNSLERNLAGIWNAKTCSLSHGDLHSSNGIPTCFSELTCTAGQGMANTYLFHGVARVNHDYYIMIGTTKPEFKNKYRRIFEEVLRSVQREK